MNKISRLFQAATQLQVKGREDYLRIHAREWTRSPYIKKALRSYVYENFTLRATSNLSMNDSDGKIFMTHWNAATEYVNNWKEPDQASTGKVTQESLETIQKYASKFMENYAKGPPSFDTIEQWRKRAVRNELVKVLEGPYPPRMPSPVLGYTHFGIIQTVKTLEAKVEVPIYSDLESYEDLVKLPKLQEYSLEWITSATMMLPLKYHDFMHLISKYKVPGSPILHMTENANHHLTRYGFKPVDMACWLKALKCETPTEAFQIMTNKKWPDFLLLYTLQRRFTVKELRSFLIIMRNHFRDLDAYAQVQALHRMIILIYRYAPENLLYLVTACQIFIKHADDSLRTSNVFNRVLYWVGFSSTKHTVARSAVVIDCMRDVLAHMNHTGMVLEGDGYSAIAFLLRFKSPAAANGILQLMRDKNFQSKVPIDVIQAAISDVPVINERLRYLPEGQHAATVVKIAMADNAEEALSWFDSVPEEALADIQLWDVMIDQLRIAKALKQESIIGIWDRMISRGAKPNKFIVDKLLTEITSAELAIEMLIRANDQGIKLASRILSQFVRCCHRDQDNSDAMALAIDVVKLLRPNDRSIDRHFRQVKRYRKWKTRQFIWEQNQEQEKDNQ
ncbi:hypothetical protein V1514DRAFT_324879 [Lipomyces japonicus]|uniref:uncharacterized protein n=1 Tax=Lipomyces japonicus TaxID=56871 RepID=UPI0034CFA0B8